VDKHHFWVCPKEALQLIESGARADKGFKEKEVNQVAKLLREFSGMEATATQVYNHLRKSRQR